MPEENVTQESLPEQEQNVTEEVVQPQEESVESQEQTTETPSAGVTAVSSEVDELGVPYENRYREMKRKYEDNGKQLEEMKSMIQSLQQNKQQPKYTKEELMNFISSDETQPAHRAWALKEIDKLEEQKVSETIKKEFLSYETKKRNEKIKADTYGYVVQRNPDLVIKDNAGNVVGWNVKSPLVQKMDAYMRNPEIANNPQGLRVALALAKDDLSGVQVAKQQKLKTQVRNLQKGTLVEGGTVSPVKSSDSLNSAKDRLRKTGSRKDALAAVSEWNKKRGKFEE